MRFLPRLTALGIALSALMASPVASATMPLPFPLVGDVDQADYLIVAPRAYQNALDRLVTFHSKNRRRVVRLSLEDIPVVAPGMPLPVAIQAAVRLVDAAAGGSLAFLLLVGDPTPGPNADAPPLPAFRAPKLPYAGATVDLPTDWPYGLLPGPPEGGDGRVLAVGRFPARTEPEVVVMVRKTIEYATDTSGDWQRRLALFAGPAKFTPFLDGIIESEAQRLLSRAIPGHFDLRFIFAKLDSPYAWRPDDLGGKLARELSGGALVAAYFGHGMPRAFDLVDYRDRYYSIGDAESLRAVSADTGRPIFVALACDIGAYDQPDGELSLAEELFQNPKGPVSVIASSRESHPYGNALYARGLIDILLKHRASTVGRGLVQVKRTAPDHRFMLAELLVDLDVMALLDEHAALYNLLGDPALVPRYPRELPLTVDRATAAPGSRVTVTLAGRGPTVVTLETDRATIRAPLEPIDGLADEDAFAAMVRNWGRATDKVIVRADVPAHTATVDLDMPEAPGTYVIKAFESGKTPAAGHLTVEVRPVAPGGGPPKGP
jgi:hypothetical protein